MRTRRAFLMIVAGVTVRWLITGRHRSKMMWALLPKPSETAQSENKSPSPSQILGKDQCSALRLHEREGYWTHRYFDDEGSTEDNNNNNSTNHILPASIERQYTPLEKSWLHGASLSMGQQCDRVQRNQGLMYVSGVGNQCGCYVDGFRPSHSTWSTAREYDGYNTPSVRLVKQLANRTLCFIGDSIDFQFYMALQNNLRRVQLLQQAHAQSEQFVNISMESTETPVHYTNETGYSYFKQFRLMTHVFRTDVTIDGLAMTFKWIKMYGWSPMYTSFADDCSVVIGNLALHYNENTLELKNPINILLLNDLKTDFRAFVGWMLDFTAGTDRKAVWRSALPQHFGTNDGHYVGGKHCSRLRPSNDTIIQKYNRLYETEFAQFCHTNQTASECRQHEHVCTYNRTNVEIGSVYRYYVGTNCCKERRERLERKKDTVTARILRWNVADVFDVVEWHAANSDCSHFCYVPQLYEAAFERLELLLA